MQTDSEELMRQGIAAGVQTFDRFLAAAGWEPGDIDRSFCHQVGAAHRKLMLESLGLKEPGLHLVARTAYKLLDLITFLTAGEDECRAWTIKRGSKAPQAAGAIHTDFERGFIKADVIWWEDLIRLGSESACRSAAKLAVEGKEYVVRDGDVIHFKFNV